MGGGRAGSCGHREVVEDGETGKSVGQVFESGTTVGGADCGVWRVGECRDGREEE